MANIFVGAAIILLPLSVFLFIMARDLDLKENSLLKRAEKLRKVYYDLKFRAQHGSKNINYADIYECLDERDEKLIKIISEKLNPGDNHSSDLTAVIYKVMRIRDGELEVLSKKIKIFKKYSIMAMMLICVSLGFLLLVSNQ
jgi:hypothetical protein